MEVVEVWYIMYLLHLTQELQASFWDRESRQPSGKVPWSFSAAICCSQPCGHSSNELLWIREFQHGATGGGDFASRRRERIFCVSFRSKTFMQCFVVQLEHCIISCNCFHLCNWWSFLKCLFATCSAGEKKLGTPGTPGGQDLAAALQRLSAQQESDSSDLFMEREHKLQQVGDVSSGFLTPNDSILSTGTNYSGISEASGSSSLSMGSRCYLPEKLQIVKPLEG